MQVIGWIIFGLFAGVIAKLMVPGRDPGGFFVTILLGIAGSLIGGYAAKLMGFTSDWFSSFVLAVAGAMIILLVYRFVKGKPASV
jgi:uncharacterized membrane protein YeaQ/YmgE (transglycosylase-associated protein family)